MIDVDFGQWGLKLLTPLESAARTELERQRRPESVQGDDIILGAFLGDQDLLLLDGVGHIRVAMPLDDRPNWPRPAEALDEFLDLFLRRNGEKFWEAR
jgi:hypothetical protein